MFHVRPVLECNRSQGKSWDAKSGWMDDRLREVKLSLFTERIVRTSN